MSEIELRVGDYVEKVSGYRFTGTVVSAFETLAGKRRVVVDNGDGMLHIFNEGQMRPATRSQSERVSRLEEAREQIRHEVINTPETADFMAGVPLEAAHQRERWGSSHDAGKTAADWFWLVGYLAGKALTASNHGDLEKAKHHTISTAAALANWHASLTGADTSMRPGIVGPELSQGADDGQ